MIMAVRNFLTERSPSVPEVRKGRKLYDELEQEGVRLFITGVASPQLDWFAPSHPVAREKKISILAAGHYSTEKFALMAMCRFFEERGLEAEFIGETPNLTDL